MEAEDRDQANAALLLNEKIDERIAEALVKMLSGHNTVSATAPPPPPSAEHMLHALLEHPMVKTRIYAQAAETARMLIVQAFREHGERMNAPTPSYYTGQGLGTFGFVYNADSMPKQRFF